MDNIKKTAIVNAGFTALYVVAVGSFMYFGALIKIGRVNSILVPITLLLLFVFSAAITGYLMFGKPILLYINGKKKEDMSLLTYTLITFFRDNFFGYNPSFILNPWIEIFTNPYCISVLLPLPLLFL